ncbi:MAG: tetratricopeptide repeat protein [Candidatus Solibacter usitatus]|nr:tetratricopeptide repeat protein [Candidatus Solibacter usitatus]
MAARLTLVLLLVFFAPAFEAGFYLDDLSIPNDPVITSTDGWRECWGLMQTRPIACTTYWANYALHGPAPAWYHADNLVLHALCVLLMVPALSAFVPARAAMLAAAFFAIHPVQTEAVIYVFARPTLLMTLFCLLALREWGKGRHWIAAAWFVPALLSKEECVAFPLFLLLLENSRALKARMAIGAMLGLSALAGLRSLYVTSHIAGSGAGLQSGISPLDYFLTQGVVLWRYAQMLVVPYGMTIDAPVAITRGWPGVVGWIAVAAVVFVCARKWRGAGMWIVASLVLIAPSSTLLPAADLAADRRLYLPMIALCAACGWWLHEKPRWIPIALTAALALVTLRQATIWRTGESLWREAVRLTPEKVRPRIQLARQLPLAGALAVLADAKKMAPDDPAIATETGRVLLESGDAARALAEFGRALALAPNDPRSFNNRGVALQQLGQRDAAADDFRRALQRDPCLFDARWNLMQLGHASPAPADCRYTLRQKELLHIGK